MPTQLLAIGTGAADSADHVVAAGTTSTVGLKGADLFGATVDIKLKDDDDEYVKVGRLTWDNPAATLSAGTYQFSRTSRSKECGVFSG